MPAQCNLIIDSCCELPREAWDQPGVFVLGLSFTFDGEEHIDDFFQAISAHDFYEAMRNGAAPSTSGASPREIERAFREAISAGVPAVYLAFSSGISGTYNTALLVLDKLKEEFGPDLPLYVVDTLAGSTTEGVIVLEALHQRERGLTAREMVEWVKEARYYVQTIFTVDNLDALHRGGRVPRSVAVAGDKLDVKPMLSWDLDGKLAVVGVARGRKKALKRMVDFYEKNHGEAAGQPVILGNADCPKDAERLEGLIVDRNEDALIMHSSIGPTIGCHVGPGMASCCFWGDDRRKSLSVTDRIANKVKGN